MDERKRKLVLGSVAGVLLLGAAVLLVRFVTGGGAPPAPTREEAAAAAAAEAVRTELDAEKEPEPELSGRNPRLARPAEE